MEYERVHWCVIRLHVVIKCAILISDFFKNLSVYISPAPTLLLGDACPDILKSYRKEIPMKDIYLASHID